MKHLSSRNLIKEILSDLNSRSDDEKMFVDSLIKQIDEFNKTWDEAQDDVLGFVLATRTSTKIPKEIPPEKYDDYVRFAHFLMKTGPCVGMVREDPIGAQAIITAVMPACRDLIRNRNVVEAFSKTLDFVIMQCLAFVTLGAFDSAKEQLDAILALLRGKGPLSDLLSDAAQEEIQWDLSLRAATASLLWADLCKLNSDYDKQIQALALANRLFEELLLDDDISFPGTELEHAMALLEFAELSYQAEDAKMCNKLLGWAIQILNRTKEKYPVVDHMKSLVYQRRAETYLLKMDNWKKAFDYIEKSVEHSSLAYNRARLNTYFQDHYAEVLSEQGIMHGTKHNLLAAQNCFLRAIELRENLSLRSSYYKVGLAAAMNNMSVLMERHGNADAAIAYLDAALEIVGEFAEDEDETKESSSIKIVSILQERAEELREEMKPRATSWAKTTNSEFGPN